MDREKDDHALEEKILKRAQAGWNDQCEGRGDRASGASALGHRFSTRSGKIRTEVSTGIPKYLPRRRLLPCFLYKEKKEAQVKRQIYAGEVQANPYELNGSTGCDYCAYRDICGFDPLDGYAYRSLEKYSKEEVIRRMEEEIRKQGGTVSECTVDRRSEKKVIELRNRNILVSAAAGSGKTAVLVERIIQRLLDERDPLDVDRLLIVTFTEAAAAEMKERIRDAIENAPEDTPGNVHLQRQATLIHSARITTIHSFACL